MVLKSFILSQFWRQKALNQRIDRAMLPLKAEKKPSLLLPSFWWLPAVLGVPWLQLHCSNFYLSLSGHLPAVYVGLCVSLLIRISVFKLGPTLIQYALILTNYTCRDPTSK